MQNKPGLLQRELAEMAGVTESAVRNYELGLRVPRPQHLEALARAIGEARGGRRRRPGRRRPRRARRPEARRGGQGVGGDVRAEGLGGDFRRGVCRLEARLRQGELLACLVD